MPVHNPNLRFKILKPGMNEMMKSQEFGKNLVKIGKTILAQNPELQGMEAQLWHDRYDRSVVNIRDLRPRAWKREFVEGNLTRLILTSGGTLNF